MWWWAGLFLAVAAAAAIFAFAGVADSTADIGRVVFFVFLGLFVLSVAGQMVRGRRT